MFVPFVENTFLQEENTRLFITCMFGYFEQTTLQSMHLSCSNNLWETDDGIQISDLRCKGNHSHERIIFFCLVEDLNFPVT